jgi:DNA repair photolyase
MDELEASLETVKITTTTQHLPSIELAVTCAEPPVIGPIEKKMRASLEGLEGSNYPDTFDWGVYDKISARFGDESPRGGVVFNTTLKLVNYHSTCSKCHYAFEIDSYGRGCTHNCTYCYAKESLSAHGYWNRPMPFPVNLAEVRKIFYTVFESDRPSKWRTVLEQRTPLRLGSMSDSFMWMDRKYKITQELLKILNFYDYPHIIFTRSDLVAEEEYLKILRKDLVSVQFSMSGGNEAITRQIEPGAPSIERRLEALKTLADHEYWTTVRLNPFFPIYPDGYYTDEKSIIKRFGTIENVPRFNLFDWEFISQLREAKVPSVLAGFVRLSTVANKSMAEATGTDLRKFFKTEVQNSHSDKKYSDSEIAYYYKRLQVECAKNKIRFNTCYIGNGIKDYYQYQNLWSNGSDCCDAKGNVRAFQRSSQDIPWELRIKQAPCKTTAEMSMLQEQENEQKLGAPLSNIQPFGLRLASPLKSKESDYVEG